MSESRSAIVTVAFGHSTEHLNHTFSSFAMNRGVALHAFIIGRELPKRRLDGIEYHLIAPVPDFSHPLREIYFRRLELIDRLGVDFALVVDSYDVLCLQPLPPFAQLLGGSDAAACVEHQGSRYVLGQGYTSNFLNGGVFLWNVPRSRDIREEIVACGRAHFRTVADDQHCLNEVIQTKYFDRLRILPCQYNYRCNLPITRQRGWPTVKHLDGVIIYHNAASIIEAKKLLPVKSRAALPDLPIDGRPLSPREQFWRRLHNRFKPWIAK
ncbi:MAG TPA: hypothetical protein VGI63_04295 [Verrucomicrobiae bacterium]|jgi:hypothetical protein